MAQSNPPFMSGVPELLLLRLLKEQEMYGYEHGTDALGREPDRRGIGDSDNAAGYAAVHSPGLVDLARRVTHERRAKIQFSFAMLLNDHGQVTELFDTPERRNSRRTLFLMLNAYRCKLSGFSRNLFRIDG
jgi:hypothetical protein